jgi:hypothetical protein
LAHGRLALITTQEGLGADMVLHVDDRSASGLMGVLTRATNQVRGLPAKVDELEKRLEELAAQVVQVEGADRSEFGCHDGLIAARDRLAELATRAGFYTEWPPTVGVEPSSRAQMPTSSAPWPST